MSFIIDTPGGSSEFYFKSFKEWESNNETDGGTSFELLLQQYFLF